MMTEQKPPVLPPDEVTTSSTFRSVVILGDALAAALGGARGFNLPIFIDGPSGSGKEWMARRMALIAGLEIIAINCAAIPQELAESALFGHERGSFSGASHLKHGLLEKTEGKLIFLDEIGKAPLQVQAKLLRVIEERVLYRVGGTKPVEVGGRFVLAASEDIEELIARRQFFEDLWNRIKTARLTMPALEARRDDIPQLAAMFASNLDAEITPEAMDVLQAARWTGNVRELRNNIRAAAALGGDVIDADHCLAFLSEVKPIERDARALALKMAAEHGPRGFKHGEFRTRAAMSHGASHKLLTALVDAGDLERTKRGRAWLYHLPRLY